MGHNLDLVSLLGLPQKIRCPKCKQEIPSRFDDYDIECGAPDASKNNGLLSLFIYCHECEHEFYIYVKSKIKVREVEKDG